MHYGEDMEIPEKIIEKYIKIRRLALNGEVNERDVAKRLMGKLQREYPNIDQQATTWERMEHGSAYNDPPVDDRPHWGDLYKEQQRAKREAEWRQRFTEWGQAATSAFSWAANMASQAFGVQEARNMALEQSYTNIGIRYNNSGSRSVNIKITPEAMSYIHRMTEEQRVHYCRCVSERIASEVYKAIT